MRKTEITQKARKLKKLMAEQDKIQKQIQALKLTLKDELKRRNVTELMADEYRLKLIEVTSSRLDTETFKKNCSAIYDSFLKPVTTERFSIA